MSSEAENASKSPRPAVVSKSSDHIHKYLKTVLGTPEIKSIHDLHQATLQDLLRANNDAVFKVLWERNQLLRER